MIYNFVVMESFGKWLLRHRKALQLTQGDVAKAAGVSVSYVSTLEREQPHSLTGEHITPDREKVAALAKAVRGDINEALNLAGYASGTSNQIPELFHKIDFSLFTPRDLEDIELFVKFKLFQKSRLMQDALVISKEEDSEVTYIPELSLEEILEHGAKTKEEAIRKAQEREKKAA